DPGLADADPARPDPAGPAGPAVELDDTRSPAGMSGRPEGCGPAERGPGACPGSGLGITPVEAGAASPTPPRTRAATAPLIDIAHALARRAPGVASAAFRPPRRWAPAARTATKAATASSSPGSGCAARPVRAMGPPSAIDARSLARWAGPTTSPS